MTLAHPDPCRSMLALWAPDPTDAAEMRLRHAAFFDPERDIRFAVLDAAVTELEKADEALALQIAELAVYGIGIDRCVDEPVLSAAVRGARLRAGRARNRRDQAEAWFRDASMAWPYSCASLCEALHLDVQAIRRAVLGQRRTGSASIAATRASTRRRAA